MLTQQVAREVVKLLDSTLYNVDLPVRVDPRLDLHVDLHVAMYMFQGTANLIRIRLHFILTPVLFHPRLLLGWRVFIVVVVDIIIIA